MLNEKQELSFLSVTRELSGDFSKTIRRSKAENIDTVLRFAKNATCLAEVWLKTNQRERDAVQRAIWELENDK